MKDYLSALGRRLLARVVSESVRLAIPLVACVLVTTGALLYYTVTHLSLNTDTADMLDPRLPFRQAGIEFSRVFPQLSDELVVVVEANNAGDAEDVAQSLAEELRAHTDTVQSVFEPGGGEFFRRNGLLYLDTDELWELDDRLAAAQPLLGTLARDPSLRGLLDAVGKAFDAGIGDDEQASLARLTDRISGVIEQLVAGHPRPVRWRDELFERSSGNRGVHRQFLMVKPRVDYSSLEPAAASLALVRSLAAPLEEAHRDGGLRVRTTGSLAMNNEELVTVRNDAVLTTALSVVCVTLLLIAGLRSPAAVVAVLATMLCGLVWTAAFAVFAVGSLNLISICFAVLFIGMGVDFGIQFAMRYREELRGGVGKAAALAAAGAGVGGALTLAAVGAAMSFLAFVPTSYRGLAELGVISGFGMLVALGANLTMLPALLSLLRAPRPTDSPAPGGGQRGGFVVEHRRPILLGTLVLLAVSLWLLPRVQFDFNPLNLKDPGTESVATYIDLARSPDITPYTIGVLAGSLDEARRTASELDRLETVDKTVTLASFVPSDQDEKLQIIDGMNASVGASLGQVSTLPPPQAAELGTEVRDFHARLKNAIASATSEGAKAAAPHVRSLKRLDAALSSLESMRGFSGAQLMALQSLLVADLGKTLQRLRDALGAQPTSLDDLPRDLRERYVADGGEARIEVYPRQDLNDNHALRNFVRSVQALVPDATDSPVELLEASDTVIRACIEASAIALALTMIMHYFVLGSLADALLIAAPLLLAMLLTAATSVAIGLPFNFANIIALPLLIGLNNAYGAYLIVRRHGERHLADVMRSSTPRAVLFSGFTAIASFGVLAVSRHPGMKTMGVLITMALLYALFAALVMLPALMAEFETRRAANKGVAT